jgi:hypothetical protein
VAPGKRRLIAMDHGLCFIRSGEDLTARLSHIDKARDEHVFGLFPEFQHRLQESIIEDCANRLRQMNQATAVAILETVPSEWEVSQVAREAWADLIYRRAGFVAENIQRWIESTVPWFAAPGD